MPKFEVEVVGVTTCTTMVEVEADDEHRAEIAAIEAMKAAKKSVKWDYKPPRPLDMHVRGIDEKQDA